MVPLDGSAFAEAALPAALEVVGAAGELVLTSVAAAPEHVERDEQGRVRAYLDQQEEAIRRETFDYLPTAWANGRAAAATAEPSTGMRMFLNIRQQ